MDPHQQRELQHILEQDPELKKRLHSPSRASAHLRRRGFIAALGNSTPNPPLNWTPLPTRPSQVHGQAWIGLDGDTLLKTLALGSLPPRQKRPAVRQAWEFAHGKARMAMLEGKRYALYQEAALEGKNLTLKDPVQATLIIPAGQLCDTHDGPHLKLRCRATFGIWLALLDATGRPVPNPNHSGP